jgi:hypothetical protein
MTRMASLTRFAMNTMDIVILAGLALAAVIAAAAFAAIVRYLYDRGLADPRAAAPPDILAMYKTFAAHTRKATGRVGPALWVHGISAGLFIAIGVGYSIVRFVLPMVMGMMGP